MSWGREEQGRKKNYEPFTCKTQSEREQHNTQREILENCIIELCSTYECRRCTYESDKRAKLKCSRAKSRCSRQRGDSTRTRGGGRGRGGRRRVRRSGIKWHDRSRVAGSE
jgi:hypothetical protein